MPDVGFPTDSLLPFITIHALVIYVKRSSDGEWEACAIQSIYDLQCGQFGVPPWRLVAKVGAHCYQMLQFLSMTVAMDDID